MATVPAVLESPNGSIEAYESRPLAGAIDVRRVEQTIKALNLIKTFVHEQLVEGIDFGLIPGTGEKPTLFQAGAQKTALLFNAYADHDPKLIEMADGHCDVRVRTTLKSRTSGETLAVGLGSCSTMESKYRYRNASLKCPDCSQELRRSKGDRKGFYCWAKTGGCGAEFGQNDKRVTAQKVGKVENPDIFDVRNTVLKIAIKRSFVAASLSLGCLSELFTQDLDDAADLASYADEAPRQAAPSPGPRKSPAKDAEPPRERNAARDDVNSTFPLKGQRQKAAEEPARPDWKTFTDRLATKWNDDWANELALENVARDKRVELCNTFSLTNYLVTTALESGSMERDEVASDRDPNKRDAKKSVAAAASQFRRWPREVEELLEQHLDDKRQELREKLGIPSHRSDAHPSEGYDNDDRPGVDENREPPWEPGANG